jgi:hypothetical protein
MAKIVKHASEAESGDPARRLRKLMKDSLNRLADNQIAEPKKSTRSRQAPSNDCKICVEIRLPEVIIREHRQIILWCRCIHFE